MHDIIAASGDSFVLDAVAWIGIPIFLALCTAIFAVVRGSIRLGQYMARSEESQESVAKSNLDIKDSLAKFIEKTNHHLGVHDQEIAILKYKTGGPNGRPRKVADPVGEDDGL